MKNVLFDEGSKEFLLGSFGCSVDEEGYVFNDERQERVLTVDGSELEVRNFGALKKGSLKFIESDLGSLLSVVDDL